MGAGVRVKTDRRDAQQLARCHRAGNLTVWVPAAAHEALRDPLRAPRRWGQFLLRRGRRAPEEVRTWTRKDLLWLTPQRLEHGAQETT